MAANASHSLDFGGHASCADGQQSASSATETLFELSRDADLADVRTFLDDDSRPERPLRDGSDFSDMGMEPQSFSLK
jgi:hypothetical protein